MATFELTKSLINKFNQRYQVNAETGCWLWTGAVLVSGHPYISIDADGKKSNAFAAQISFEIKNGKPDERIKLGRTCNNLLCVNPDHIFKIQNKKKLGDYQSPNLCIVENCERSRMHKDSKLCNFHHIRFLRGEELIATPKKIRHEGTLEERFHQKYTVDETTGCWLWNAGKQSDSYGTIQNGRQNLLAHRVSYQIHYGDIPDGLCVCHVCDIRNCVNPEHLFLGTDQDNADDKMEKGRHRLCSIQDLTPMAIADIRINKELKKMELARKYSVSLDMVNAIRKGVVGKYINDDGSRNEDATSLRRLTVLQAFFIKASTLSVTQLSILFQLTKTSVWAIKGNKTYKDLTTDLSFLDQYSDEDVLKELEFLTDEQKDLLFNSFLTTG